MTYNNLKRHWRFPEFRDAAAANFQELYSQLGQTESFLPTPYLGCVSNLGRAADNLGTGYTTSMSVTTRTAQSDITQPRIQHHNFYSNASNTAERFPGGPCTYVDWVEYPIGVAYYGGTTIVAADGGIAINDLGVLPVTIPKGAMFRLWTKRTGAQVFTGGRGSWHLGAGFLANPQGVDLLPQLGHVFYPNAAWVNTYWPTVLDMTTRRSVLIIGDSHEQGEGERGEPDMRGFYGPAERFFTDRAGWCNMSTRGLSLQSFIASHTQRVGLAQYYSEVYIGLGGNDVNAGRNAGQMFADLDTIIGYFPGKGLLSCTEMPKTTSTDSWTTTANQTPATYESNSREFSRGKWYGQRFKRVYDWARGVGFFKTDGTIVLQPNITADGSHLNATGNQMAASGEYQNPIFY